MHPRIRSEGAGCQAVKACRHFAVTVAVPTSPTISIRSASHFTEFALAVAFTKEESAETAAETQLPDRAISPHPNLVTATGLKALELQLKEAREAYDAAQTTDDINERRRLSASPLRDIRYFSE